MNRMFPVFAALAISAVAVAMLVGLSLGDFHASAQKMGEVRAKLSASHLLSSGEVAELRAQNESLKKTEDRASLHRILGFGSGIGVLWASSLSVIYFLGTSRWCKEVTEAYGLHIASLQRSLQLKRRAFAISTVAMTVAVIMVALGGANDPSTGRPGAKDWVQVHFYGAMFGIAVLMACFAMIHGYIVENQGIIQHVMNCVREERARRKQPVH